MPYLPPSPGASLPPHSQGRARHRRSYSENVPPSSPGAFAPLGVPKRRTNGTVTTTPSGGPKFHFKNDQETSDSDSEDDTVSRNPYPPAVKLKPRLDPSFGSAGSGNVPFPTSSSKYSPTKPESPQLLSPGTNSPRPNLPRNNSTPIFLSNGKPLKSSLKSSTSSPAISPTHSPAHLRAASAPCTPGVGPSSSPSSTSTPSTPVTPHKNVHFPREEEGGQLVSVRIYSRSARPASVSLPLSQSFEDTETETETDNNGGPFRQPSFATAGSSSMPFPKLPARSRSQTLPSHAPTKAPTISAPIISTPGQEKRMRKVWELDTIKSSAVPSYSPSVYGNVYIESLTLTSSSPSTSSSTSSPPTQPQIALKGTLLVRNLAYEKTVALRFTLDEWETTSEVLAHYVESLPSLPRDFFKAGSGLKSVDATISSAADSPSSPPPVSSPTWDRFGFTLKLDDYAPSLHTRTLWLVARYAVPYVHTRAHSMDDLASFAALFSSGSSTPTSTSSNGIPIHGASGGRRGSAGEWELGMARMGVLTGQGGEWWDNNGGGNYRVVFKVKEVEEPVVPTTPPVLKVDTGTPTQELVNGAVKVPGDNSSDEEAPRTKKNELGLKHMHDSGRERKNGGSYPFPITAATLGTPTITFSPASPPTNSYFPAQPPVAPSLSRFTAQQHVQMAKEAADAKAKTTMAHLKGLSLKNYAAPATTPPKVSPPVVAPGIQRSRSASPTLDPHTTNVANLGVGHAPGAVPERERSASTGSIPPIPPSASTSIPSITPAAGIREITPSMMNMNVSEASGAGMDILSSSPGMVMSTSPPYMGFGMGGRKWAAPTSSVLRSTSNSSQGQPQDGDDRSDTSSTSSNSASDTPPLLSPLMSPVVEFSSFGFDGGSANNASHHHSWGMGISSFGGMFGGFPATIVSDPQSGELGMGEISAAFGEPYNYEHHEADKKHHLGRKREPSSKQPPKEDGDFNLHWPWGTRDADKKEAEEDKNAEQAMSPSAASNASTITPGEEGHTPPVITFRPRQPSPQSHPSAAALSKPRRPHSPLANPALNRTAIKRSGGLSSSSRESSLESISELASKAGTSGVRPSSRAVPPHITNKPFTSSPLQSPLNSPRHSPRNSPRTSPRTSPSISPSHSESEIQLPIGPGTTATDSVYQAFVKQWCFAQGSAVRG